MKSRGIKINAGEKVTESKVTRNGEQVPIEQEQPRDLILNWGHSPLLNLTHYNLFRF